MSGNLQTILITGASRGIGLALVEQYLNAGDFYVFATCRNPENADELQTLVKAYPDNVSLIRLDISDVESIQSSLQAVSAQTDTLDILVNNGAIYPRNDETRTFGALELEALTQVMAVNGVAPLIVTQAYAPLLKNAENPRVIMVSSEMGSLHWTSSGGSYGYRMSKAAMNMAARTLAMDSKLSNITIITTHPGNVQTVMSGLKTGMMPDESASGLFKLISNLSHLDNGKFYKWNGEEHAW